MTQDIVLMAFNHVAHADNVSKSTDTHRQGEDSITKMELKVKMYEEYGNFSKFSYRLNSCFNHTKRKVILKYDYDIFKHNEEISFDETKKISISDKGIITLIELIRD